MKKSNRYVVVIALLLIGVASVAYAAFSQVLTISGTGTATGDWKVKITGITRTSGSGATDVSAPTYTDTSATFNVDLAYPGATATYEVTVTNSGTIPAKVTSVTDLTSINSGVPAYITYATSGITTDTTIAANGGTNKATVTVTWDPAATGATTSATKSATITFDYAQDTP